MLSRSSRAVVTGRLSPLRLDHQHITQLSQLTISHNQRLLSSSWAIRVERNREHISWRDVIVDREREDIDSGEGGS